MGFSRQEHLSGLPFPGYLPDPGIEPMSLMFPALAGRDFNTSTTWEALAYYVSENAVCISSQVFNLPATP